MGLKDFKVVASGAGVCRKSEEGRQRNVYKIVGELVHHAGSYHPLILCLCARDGKLS